MLCILILFHNVSNYKAKQSKENGLSKKQLIPAAHQPPILYDPNEPFYEDELDSILDDPAIFELDQQQDSSIPPKSVIIRKRAMGMIRLFFFYY